MKKALIAIMILGTALAPTAAFAQTDDAPTDRSTDSTVDQVRETDEVRDSVRHDLDAIKERALEAIDVRVEALTNAITRLGQNQHVEPEHARALIDDYEFHIRGLEALVEPIKAAETAEELRPLVESIVTEHWVFALQIPKGMLTVASDSIMDATENFESMFERIASILERLEGAGINLPGATALLAEAEASTATAAELAAPVPDLVLPISVTEMPEAGETLRAAHADIRAAHDHLVDARQNIREIVEIVKRALDDTDVATDAA